MTRPGLIVGAAIVVAAAVGTVGWLMLPPEISSSRALFEAEATPAPADTITIPESDSPPEVTVADFGQAQVQAPAAATAEPAVKDKDVSLADWAALPIDEVRERANAEDVAAMEELARRLVQGIGVAKDQQAAAGWLLRAAQRGSVQSAFNVGVMYERGFVVERDSTKAIEWYRKAAEAGVPMAKHNLALLLRDGKGAPRNGKEAVELLRSAARQGMAASMFTLGDIYERGDEGLKDPAIALAWFAITAEFERQTNKGGESALARMASQRVQVLQRILMPGELERAQQFGQAEFKQIVEALQPAKPAPPPPLEMAGVPRPAFPPLPPAAPATEPAGWPKTTTDQIRVIQQALVDLKLLRDKPDGTLGPMTRSAIRAFQRSVSMRETGEPTVDVFAALQDATRTDAAKSESADKALAAKADAPPPSPDAALDGWPSATADQVRVIQTLLRDLNFSREAPDGVLGPATRAAIRDYERSLGLAQTGEPSKTLFDSLKEMRGLTAPAPANKSD
ncbi:MAG: SEL1-like repeat protein [Rhodospirillales bacterium]|nr:SEL1-like repeat protein [Rhodospirillales bacterium]